MNETNSHTPVISIMGPTASGKTSLALAFAQQFPCEIISVDSALIYKGMDIGTAKPTVEELNKVKHWLVDIRDPSESYSVAEFCHDTNILISSIKQRGNIPVLVGGTMMYFNALINGISPLPKSNEAMRNEINAEAEAKGWHYLHGKLSEFDPESANRIHPNDPQRLTRAIEVYRTSGKTLSEWQLVKGDVCEHEITQFAIAPVERLVLHERIEQRFDLMLEQGFVQEVERLFHRGDLHQDLPAIRSVGYRQVWQHLNGELSYADMREKGIIATRQLAKRQMTWLRGWSEVSWLDTFSKDNLAKIKAQIAV